MAVVGCGCVVPVNNRDRDEVCDGGPKQQDRANDGPICRMGQEPEIDHGAAGFGAALAPIFAIPRIQSCATMTEPRYSPAPIIPMVRALSPVRVNTAPLFMGSIASNA